MYLLQKTSDYVLLACIDSEKHRSTSDKGAEVEGWVQKTSDYRWDVGGVIKKHRTGHIDLIQVVLTSKNIGL